MSEWKEYKLGTLCDVRDGTHDSPKESHEGFPLVTSKNIKNGKIDLLNTYLISESDYNFVNQRSKVDQWDILFSMIGTIGESAIVKEQPKYAIKNVGLFKTHGNQLLASWIYYYFHSLQAKEEMNACMKGSTQQYISLTDLRNFPIEMPSEDYQRKVVSVLSSLDDKINLLNRENATLEAMAETLFRQWFIEEAKEDWEEGKLGNYVIETVGGEWGKENPEGDFIKPVQCIRGTDIADLNVGLATKTPIRYVKESKFERIDPNNGDIIMEISGGTENQSTGRVTYINEDVKALFDYPIIFSNFCRLLRIKEEYTYFIYCYLRYLYNQDELFNLENGSSGIKNLDYKALLYELSYPMPNDKQQILDFNNKVRLYFKKINRNKQQIQTLIHTRDGLLPKLMSNEIAI